MNTDGNAPVSSTQGEPRTPAKKVNFDKGRNIDFFDEFTIKTENTGLGGDAVKARNRNWFIEVNARWNVDWATGWGTAETLNERPQQRAEIEARKRRLSILSYDIPIFERSRSQKELTRMSRRLNGAQFGNVLDIAALETNGITPQSLQDRYMMAAQTVDLVERTMREIRATELGITFNTLDLRHAHDLGISSQLLEEADPSLLLFDEERRPGVRETRFQLRYLPSACR